VSGRYENGIFYDLKKLKIGDTFQIEFGDKSLKTFEVVDSKQLPESDSAEFLFQKNSDIKEQLNLITCGGNFNKDSQQFADRVVIVSKLIR
jgi:LPXTG-site transpeptidase (sortase) family protein